MISNVTDANWWRAFLEVLPFSTQPSEAGHRSTRWLLPSITSRYWLNHSAITEHTATTSTHTTMLNKTDTRPLGTTGMVGRASQAALHEHWWVCPELPTLFFSLQKLRTHWDFCRAEHSLQQLLWLALSFSVALGKCNNKAYQKSVKRPCPLALIDLL